MKKQGYKDRKGVVKKFTGGMIKAATKAAFKKGSKKLRGNTQSATKRWSEDKNVGIGGRVRAAKNLTGGAKQIGDKTDQKLAKSPAATASRKQQGREAADLTQPAGGSFGKTTDRADTKIRSSKVAAKKANEFDKALSKKQKQLKTYETKRDSLKGVDKIKFIAENQTRIKSLKASIKDMKSRGGPGGKSKIKYKKKTGGPVVKKRGGGMTRQGLYPAEEARSGTMSEAKRKRYMNKGGKVSYRNMGGVVGGRMPSKDVVRYLYEISDQIDY